MTLKKRKIISAIALILISSIAIPNTIYAKGNTKTVFIDVGHGGYDNGSAHNGYVEDNISLQISKEVAKKLGENKIGVKLSREKDKYLSLSKRTEMANKSGADLFVSIHQNASDLKSPNGIETLYMGENKELAKTIQENVVETTNANDRGHKKSNLQVLRDNELPAVLIECGFISNPDEGYKLSTKAYQEKLAEGIVQGIKEYLNLETNIRVDKSKYKTTLNKVNVMSDRDKNSKIIGTLPKGTRVEVIDSKFDWLKIKYNERIGYVSGVYVK